MTSSGKGSAVSTEIRFQQLPDGFTSSVLDSVVEDSVVMHAQHYDIGEDVGAALRQLPQVAHFEPARRPATGPLAHVAVPFECLGPELGPDTHSTGSGSHWSVRASSARLARSERQNPRRASENALVKPARVEGPASPSTPSLLGPKSPML